MQKIDELTVKIDTSAIYYFSGSICLSLFEFITELQCFYYLHCMGPWSIW